MRVTYFDEVKANPQNGQDWYFVGGLSIPPDVLGNLEEQVNGLAEDVFGTSELTPATEFHAAHIYAGKGPSKPARKWPPVTAGVVTVPDFGPAFTCLRVAAWDK